MSEISNANIEQMLAQMRVMAGQAANEAAATAAPAAGPDFSSMLQNAINQVNDAQQGAQESAKAFELGDPGTNLAEVMVSLQKASISFQAMVEVRNKLLSAYQEIMSMQI